MKRENCSTRNHISVNSEPRGYVGADPVGVLYVIRGCKVGVTAWVIALLLGGSIFGIRAAMGVVAIFAILFSAVFLWRWLRRGHSVRCSVIGGIAANVRILDYI